MKRSKGEMLVPNSTLDDSHILEEFSYGELESTGDQDAYR